MRTQRGLLLSFLALFLSLSPAAHSASPPFDSFVLAISYMNDFCTARPEKQDCKEGAADAGLVLHGLWPNRNNDPLNTFQYCTDVDRALFETGQDWCAVPSLDVFRQMSAATATGLRRVMPGVASCLHNHEWYAHGTCSGMNVNHYFRNSTELTRRFKQFSRHLSLLLDRFAGMKVSRSALTRAILQDFGPAAANSVIVMCRKDKLNPDLAYFSEIQVTLNPRTYMTFPVSSSYAPTRPWVGRDGIARVNLGNCPSDAILISR